MIVFSKRQHRLFRLRLIMLAVMTVSVYPQETATPEATAPVLEHPIADSAPRPDTASTGNEMVAADSSAPAESPTPGTIPEQSVAGTTDSSTVVNAPLSPVQPADSAITTPASNSSSTTSNFYGGSAAVYTGTGRGVASPQPAGRVQRTRIVDTTAPPPRGVDSTRTPTVAEPDHLSKATAATGHDAATPVTSIKTPRAVKLIAAIGTTTAIGCIVALILKVKLSDSDENNVQRIPDPPEPPGY